MSNLVLIFFAMGCQDVLQALYTRFMVSRRYWLAGGSDGTIDVLTFILVVGSVTSIPRTPAWLGAAAAVLFTSSTLGTVIGGCFDEWLEQRHPPKPKEPHGRPSASAVRPSGAPR